MTDEDRQAGEVVLCAISPFVVGLVARDDDGREGRMIGTGTALRFRTSNMVLIADHVLRNSVPEDIFFIPPPANGFRLSTSGTDSPEYNWRFQAAFRGVRDESLDVAALVFDNEIPGCRFFDLPETASTPGKNTPVAICGYPRAKAKPFLWGDVVGFIACPDFQGATLMDPDAVGDLRSFQFAIDYPDNTGVPPSGYSGAMVWYDRAGCRTLEELRERLDIGAAGIVTDHRTAHAALACTKIESIIHFLQQNLE